MTESSKTFYISTFIAILFHISGAIGMHTDARPWFISMTPLTLLLMSALILWNEKSINKSLWIYFALCAIVGFLAEVIGTNTGLLFGNYAYGNPFGFKIAAVPVLIGLLWFVTVYAIGNLVLFLYRILFKNPIRSVFVNFVLIVLAAAITTLFDYILEPAAISLGYWQWLPDGNIPTFNYVCWFFISGFLHVPFFMNESLSQKINPFTVVLIFIQAAFFIVVVL
jgi:putative membrane protein